MRLLEVRLTRYRQFIDEVLRVAPKVTVIVGKNDSGKTGLLDHFFDQCVYEGIISGGDRPSVPQHMYDHVQWSLRWEILPDDYDTFPLPGPNPTSLSPGATRDHWALRPEA